MALSINIKDRSVFGNKRVVIAEVNFDSSYPTGGEPLTPSDLGLQSIDFLNATSKAGYIFEYDYTNQKLKCLYSTRSQVSNLAGSVTVPSYSTTYAEAGTYSVSFTGTKGTVDAGVAEEVANATDLSALTNVRIFCFGC